MKSPLTGSLDCTLLDVLDVEQIAKRWHDELGIDWTPSLGFSEIQYWQDLRTGLKFYTPAELAGGEDLYQQLQQLPWYYQADKWEFKRAVALLNASLPDSAHTRLLEVGVGQGHFLELARSAAYQVAGVELNPDAAQVAQSKGFEIFSHDLRQLHQHHSGAWDALCAFQVLEHLAAPGEFIADALELLRPGGYLILSVPNSPVSRFLDPEQQNLLDQPPHHMSHWDVTVFRSLESLFPVRICAIESEPLAEYHIGWFLSAVSSRSRARLPSFGSRLILNRYSLRLWEWLLLKGLRRFVRGHALVVCLQKL